MADNGEIALELAKWIPVAGVLWYSLGTIRDLQHGIKTLDEFRKRIAHIERKAEKERLVIAKLQDTVERLSKHDSLPYRPRHPSLHDVDPEDGTE